MDNFGDLLGGLGDMLGGLFGSDSAAEGAMGLAEIFAPDGRRAAASQTAAYERYLCGGPAELNVNDR